MALRVLALGVLLVSYGDAQATCPFASMLSHVGKAIPRLSNDGVEAASVEILEFSATSQVLTQGPGRTLSGRTLQQEDAEFSSQDSFADVADDDSVFTLVSLICPGNLFAVSTCPPLLTTQGCHILSDISPLHLQASQVSGTAITLTSSENSDFS